MRSQCMRGPLLDRSLILKPNIRATYVFVSLPLTSLGNVSTNKCGNVVPK